MKKPKKEFWFLAGLVVLFFIVRRKAQPSISTLTVSVNRMDNNSQNQLNEIMAIRNYMTSQLKYYKFPNYKTAVSALKGSLEVADIYIESDENNGGEKAVYKFWNGYLGQPLILSWDAI